MNPDPPIEPDPLPHEPGSSAEPLAATHLFTAELLSTSDDPWVRAADGYEHRRLRLGLSLMARLKGRLRLLPGEEFGTEVPHRRENALVVSEYHGFWSHADVVVGGRYLVVAAGDGDDPAALMQEPDIKALLDAALAADVE